MILAPARSVRASTVELLGARLDARQPVVLVEPAPHLVEGEQSHDLERVLIHRRTRRVGVRHAELERDLVDALAKAHVDAVARLFRREDGLPPGEVQQLVLRSGRQLYVTVMHREESAVEALLEVRGECSIERWCGDSWQRWECWNANENTYAEWDAQPNVAHVFRMEPADASP